MILPRISTPMTGVWFPYSAPPDTYLASQIVTLIRIKHRLTSVWFCACDNLHSELPRSKLTWLPASLETEIPLPNWREYPRSHPQAHQAVPALSDQLTIVEVPSLQYSPLHWCLYVVYVHKIHNDILFVWDPIVISCVHMSCRFLNWVATDWSWQNDGLWVGICIQ